MEQKTEIIEAAKAALIQKIHDEYKCEIIELGLSLKNMVKITVQGAPEDLQKLFEFINKPKDEDTEATTV